MAKKSGKTMNRNISFAPGATVVHEYGTGTDSSQAITLHEMSGRITSSTTNLAAATTQAITLTNKYIKATSHVSVQVSGGGAGDPVVGIVTPADGSCVITILNADQSNACNAAYVVSYMVFN